MAFLPDGRLLVTEKRGALKLVDVASGKVGDIKGVPEVDYGGQGGFGDIALHPDFADRSEEHTSELQSLMRISYAVFCLKQKTRSAKHNPYAQSLRSNNNRVLRHN